MVKNDKGGFFLSFTRIPADILDMNFQLLNHGHSQLSSYWMAEGMNFPYSSLIVYDN